MEKAYDVKDLGSKIVIEGKEIGEAAAKAVVVAVIAWLEESAKLSENKYDDLVPFSLVKNEALKLVDKIDGVEG